jgi:hypothetical protein
VLPNAIVIGAKKCGTSALHHYLGHHPEIQMSQERELNFFSGQNWKRGIEWYESNFPPGPARVRGETSPQYSRHPMEPGTPERMHGLVPDVKLIYLVRDPIDRLVSHWVGSWVERRERRSFVKAVRPLPDNAYVCVSSYAMQLERYLRWFPPEHILVLAQEELLERRRATLRRVFGFLEVDEAFESPAFDEQRNPTSTKREVRRPYRRLLGNPVAKPRGRLSWATRHRIKSALYKPFTEPARPPALGSELREQLAELLAPDADRLRRLTGKRFEHWSV